MYKASPVRLLSQHPGKPQQEDAQKWGHQTWRKSRASRSDGAERLQTWPDDPSRLTALQFSFVLGSFSVMNDLGAVMFRGAVARKKVAPSFSAAFFPVV